MLIAQRQAAPAGAVVVGVVAVGVEAVGDALGEPGELFGPVLAALLGQIRFGALAGLYIHPARQLVAEASDHRHLPGAQLAVALPGCRGRQQRCQRLAGQRAPRPQIGGLVDAAGGFGAA